jgi:reactive chlorine resistance protein C
VQIGEKLSDLGTVVSRYGLVLVIFWIGAMKFSAYEANGIQPLVANSPFMGWLYGFLSVQAFSNSLGVVEIAIAVMIGLRSLSPKVSAIGSATVRRQQGPARVVWTTHPLLRVRYIHSV